MYSIHEKLDWLIDIHRARAQNGDLLSQDILGDLLYIKAGADRDISLLDEADYWLNKAAEGGRVHPERFLINNRDKLEQDIAMGNFYKLDDE